MDSLKLNAFIDEVLEKCGRQHLGLGATMDRFLSAVSKSLGASAALVKTMENGEAGQEFSFGHGPFPQPPRALSRRAVLPSSGRTWVFQRLDMAGRKLGTAAFAFDGHAEPKRLEELVGVVCEQLDGVLWSIQTAKLKQALVERITRLLTRRVFGQALDDAVRALHEAVAFDAFAVVYVDEGQEGTGRILYRVYRGDRCIQESETRPHRALDRAIAAQGLKLLEPEKGRLGRVLGFKSPASFSMIAGVARARCLGGAVLSVPRGLDAFGQDLMRVFANAVSQRLVDYNRERRHLGQFFPPAAIDKLLDDPDYQRKHLSPRVETVALLYADINSFTRICEQALKRPDRIGDFVNRWSARAVDIVWKHGGVFDKMVGDCVIAHFGPPFFEEPAAQRALAALSSAFEIQAFTKGLESDPDFAPLAARAGLPGLGVAIGVNLCSAAVGLFGPNQDFTAFSRGMNETARLQSHAGFRETLAMESVREALRKSRQRHGYSFEGPREAKVKNVDKPLRYYLVKAH